MERQTALSYAGTRVPLRGLLGLRGVRRLALAITTTMAIVVTSALVAPSVAAAPAHTAATRLASFDAQMVTLVNNARTSHGLPAVQHASGLTEMSVWWSKKMLASHTLKHTPSGLTVAQKYGAANLTTWGENVGKFPTSASAQQLFDAYWASPGHKANILGKSYRYIGMGSVSDGTTGYNAMEFTDFVESPAPTKKPAATKTKKKPAAKAAAPANKPAAKAAAPAKKAATAPKAPAEKPAAKAAAPAKKAATAPKAPAEKPAAQTLRQAPSKPAQAPKAPAPKLVSGSVAASFGSLGVSGITVEVRDSECDAVIAKAVTATDGSFPITIKPGDYCATVVDAPAGVQQPNPISFSVSGGETFSITWGELTPSATVTKPVARSEFVMRPL